MSSLLPGILLLLVHSPKPVKLVLASEFCVPPSLLSASIVLLSSDAHLAQVYQTSYVELMASFDNKVHPVGVERYPVE